MDHGNLSYHFPDHSIRQLIAQAMTPFRSTEEAWRAAQRGLNQSVWNFEGDPYLDDTGDEAFHGRFDRQTGLDIIAGIAAKRLEGSRFTFRNAEIQPDGKVAILLPKGSAMNLQQLAPGMTLHGYSRTAGREI